MKKSLLAFAFTLFILTACTTVQAPENGNVDVAKETEDTSAETVSSIYGHWVRTATYVGGVLEGQVPADLFINEDGSYQSSSADCSTSGTQVVTDNSIAVSMTQSNCPGNIALPFNITYTFEIAEDGESMSMITADIKEDYVRAD